MKSPKKLYSQEQRKWRQQRKYQKSYFYKSHVSFSAGNITKFNFTQGRLSSIVLHFTGHNFVNFPKSNHCYFLQAGENPREIKLLHQILAYIVTSIQGILRARKVGIWLKERWSHQHYLSPIRRGKLSYPVTIEAIFQCQCPKSE